MKLYLLYRVKNIVIKGEIAHYEQFLLLSQCFQKLCAAESWERVNLSFEQFLFLPQWFKKLSAADESESVYMWERVKIRHIWLCINVLMSQYFVELWPCRSREEQRYIWKLWSLFLLVIVQFSASTRWVYRIECLFILILPLSVKQS